MDPIFELSIYWVLALSLVAFCAGYVDAVAGGGGMLNLPALLFAGVPPISSLAVSKVTAIAGTTLAVAKYALGKRVQWKIVAYAAIPCLLASYVGGMFALKLSATFLAWAIIICIPIALIIVLRDKPEAHLGTTEDRPIKAIAALAPIGFYDGILGPGTGTYMAIAVRKILKFDLLKATATIKPLNLFTNIGAAVAFLLAGKVIWAIALPMIAASSLGGWIGGHSAIKGGDKFIRRLLIIVLTVMLTANVIKMFM
ncbi:TSUP family transporter [uncultured Cocleimonas sp.]|uniref:sulfite exporter TauE/SafE family protein n=1 Tax=uncultured Cocleimonas sp. TaxID=1051587 RepID=UPI0026092AD8|nr:TSUP family transporter [uncultured Cocleimonas sp.]